METGHKIAIGIGIGLLSYIAARAVYILHVPPWFKPTVKSFKGNNERWEAFSFGGVENSSARGAGRYAGYTGILAQLTGADTKWQLNAISEPEHQEFTLLKNGVPEKVYYKY
mgnify:CR=1 FL=1